MKHHITSLLSGSSSSSHNSGCQARTMLSFGEGLTCLVSCKNCWPHPTASSPSGPGKFPLANKALLPCQACLSLHHCPFGCLALNHHHLSLLPQNDLCHLAIAEACLTQETVVPLCYFHKASAMPYYRHSLDITNLAHMKGSNIKMKIKKKHILDTFYVAF